MAADRPLRSNFFPGLLEGLLGRLGIDAPGEGNPPTSSREGAGHLWSSAMHEAISQIEQREVETQGTAGLPQCLDLCYEEDFLKKQSHQIPAVIPSMANAVYKVVKPPVVLKTFPSASGRKVPSVSSQPEDGGPKPEVSKQKESAPSTPKPSQQVQERVTEASNTDSDKADEPTPEEEQPPQGLKVKIPIDSGNTAARLQQVVPKMVPLPPKYGRNWKPMRLRPQPRPDLSRQPSGKLGSSCTKRTFRKSRKSVSRSLVLKKGRRPLKRILTPHLASN